ncbi:MAG: FGGY family carbohydrate kinase, partial [Candidatus Nanopelagicales bacterium]
DVAAMGVAAQQHGMVTLDASGEVVRPALLWNDTRSAADAADLVAEWGGPQGWADAVGSVPVASFTVSKVRWLARHEPASAERVARVLLPHDWLTWKLAGCPAEATTDRGDVSGTGYWSPATGEYRRDLLALAFGREYDVPRVAAPHEIVGETAAGIALSPGTGDNMGAALGVGALPGDVVVSLGTSGTAFAVSDRPTADASGQVAGFADATGRFLPLVCTLNAARVLTATASMLGVGMDDLTSLALTAPPGSGGLVLLPYLDGERTPNLPDATGTLAGLTRDAMTPAHLARASVEGMLCGLADAVDALRAQGVRPRRILLVGGAAANPAVQRIATTVFDVPVVIPQPGEYVADGAARQAAWALAGTAEPPAWALAGTVELDPAPVPGVREAYAEAFRQVHGGA